MASASRSAEFVGRPRLCQACWPSALARVRSRQPTARARPPNRAAPQPPMRTSSCRGLDSASRQRLCSAPSAGRSRARDDPPPHRLPALCPRLAPARHDRLLTRRSACERWRSLSRHPQAEGPELGVSVTPRPVYTSSSRRRIGPGIARQVRASPRRAAEGHVEGGQPRPGLVAVGGRGPPPRRCVPPRSRPVLVQPIDLRGRSCFAHRSAARLSSRSPLETCPQSFAACSPAPLARRLPRICSRSARRPRDPPHLLMSGRLVRSPRAG